MTLCWWCCNGFEGDALHLPYKHDEMRNRFHTMGVFCSWGCMKTFTIDRYGLSRGGIICMNIHAMRKQMTGHLSRITKAPDRYSLKEFGGTMDIEEFRSVTADTFPVVTMPDESFRIQMVGNRPFETRDVTQTIQKQPIGYNQDDKMAAIQNSSSHNEPLRLKRPKPLKRDQNNLESTLGIVRKRK